MSLIRLSRRAFALALLFFVASPHSALPQAPSDRGIGGTGAAPTLGDRGIGGTGVIGTIRKFGSIYVNGLRIAYPPDAAIFIDGAPARPADMKIGHVAQAVAMGPDAALATRRIDIATEVIGPIDKLSPNGVIVLGQSVDLRALKRRPDVKPGAFVAVSGQRRQNGVIVASLIEPRAAGPTKVAGPAQADVGGRLSIGGLALRGAPASLAGTRISVKGVRRGEVYSVSSFESLARPFGPEVRRLSIEGYVGPGGRLGSGLAVAGATAAPGLAVISGRVDGAGRLISETIRRDTRLDLPEAGGPIPLKPATDLLPSLPAPNLLGGSGALPRVQPGRLLPATPSFGLPSGGGGGVVPGAPSLGLPGGGLPGGGLTGGGLPGGGLPGLRR